MKYHEAENKGVLAHLEDQDFINRIYQNQKSSTFILEKQNAFFATLGAFHTGKNFLANPFVIPAHFETDRISMVGLNTSIFSMAGTNGSDRGKLPFPDTALNEALQEIPKNNFVIAVHHHPLDWFTEASAKEIKTSLSSRVNLHVYGHLHDPEPKLVRTPTGSLIGIQLPSLFSTRQYHNGYSIITITPEDHHVRTTFRTYWDARRRFDKGINIAADGVFFPTEADEKFYLLSEEYLSHQKLRMWVSDFVGPHLAPTLDECSVDKPLSSIFVEPPIIQALSVDNATNDTDLVELETKVSLKAMAQSEGNYFVLVPPENGQTTLAKKLASTFIEEYGTNESNKGIKPRVPVIIDVQETKLYDANIFRRVKEWLPETISLGHTSQSLINQGFISFIIENVSASDNDILEQLAKLRAKFPKCRYIYFVRSPLLIAASRLHIPYDEGITKLEVRPFTRSLVRKLVELWRLDKSFSTDIVVEQLIARFRMLAIPLTAVNISIFLTVLETVRGFVPINTASLIENYIDVVLEKFDLKSTFRSAFDYKNKIDFLAYIAKTMVERNDFRLEYADIYAIGEDYFKTRALNQRPQDVIEYFVGAKIFENVGNYIQFRLDIFQTYFIAQAMIVDQGTKGYVLNNFARFIQEIDIYCGLQRGDRAVINQISEEFAKATKELFTEIPVLPDIEQLDSFVLPAATSVSKVLERITNHAFSDKLNRESKDRLVEESERDSRSGNVQQRLSRPEVRNIIFRWVLALRAYSFCVKNLELIDAAEKERHLANVLQGWGQALTFAVFTMRMMFVDKEFELGNIKFKIDHNIDEMNPNALRFMFLTVPVYISYYMRNDVGSEKLEMVLRKEGIRPSSTLEFLRACLFLDLRLTEYPSFVQRLAKKINRNRFLLEALIMKLRDFYLRSSLDKPNDDAIRKVMAELFQVLPRDQSPAKSKDSASRDLQGIRRKKVVRQIRDSIEQIQTSRE